jgi:hypothetical protein
VGLISIVHLFDSLSKGQFSYFHMAKFGKTTPPRTPPGPPASTKDGAAAVLKAAVKLFDKGDGNGVDWRMMAEILFFAAFDALDQRHRIAKSVESGAFKRYSAADADEFAANRAGPGRDADQSPGAGPGAPGPRPPG